MQALSCVFCFFHSAQQCRSFPITDQLPPRAMFTPTCCSKRCCTTIIKKYILDLIKLGGARKTIGIGYFSFNISRVAWTTPLVSRLVWWPPSCQPAVFAHLLPFLYAVFHAVLVILSRCVLFCPSKRTLINRKLDLWYFSPRVCSI